MKPVKAFVDGVEVVNIPALAGILGTNDWYTKILLWAAMTRPPGTYINIIVSLDRHLTDDGDLLELWIGDVPSNRAMEIGGALKSFIVRDRSDS